MKNMLTFLYTFFLLVAPLFTLIAKNQLLLIPQYEHRISISAPVTGFSYERVKLHGFYVGIDTNYIFPTFDVHTMLDIEARLGYLFSTRVFHGTGYDFIPTIGGGYAKVNKHTALCLKGNREERPEIAYVCVGCRFRQYQMMTDKFYSLEIGINAQGIVASRLAKHWEDEPLQYGKITEAFPVFGFKGSIPLILRFGKSKNWDFRIEPGFFFLSKHTVNVTALGQHSLYDNDYVWYERPLVKQIKEGSVTISAGRRF